LVPEQKITILWGAFLSLSKALAVLLLGGGLIGILHRSDRTVAVILAISALYMAWRTYRPHASMQRGMIIAAGMLLTSCIGIQAELWGIGNGHWHYHNLPGGRQFPTWLPFAWMLAFVILYRVEESLVERMKLVTLKEKLLLAAGLSLILPVWGEIVAINLGVWTYTWNYQFFGVPLLAIGLLMILHLTVFMLFTVICRLRQANDPVFGIPPTTN
jgi:hypothetical protein